MAEFGKAIQKLVEKRSSPAIGGQETIQIASESALVDDLVKLLASKNGFYAFEGALHVFHFGSGGSEYDLVEWNRDDLWKQDYQGMADGLLFFAEDVFGGQFALDDTQIVRFDPETGETEPMAPSFEAWAQKILDDFDYETGYSLAHDWQVAHGQLQPKTRLIAKVPFVLGGEFEVENLQAIDSVRGMQVRANLATQIRDLPEGAEVRFEITD